MTSIGLPRGIATVEYEGAARGRGAGRRRGDPVVHLMPSGTAAAGLLADGAQGRRQADREAGSAPAVPVREVRVLPPLAPPTVRDFVAFSNMGSPVEDLVVYASHGTTVRPGELPPLQVADVVTLTVEGIGTVADRVVAGVDPVPIPRARPRPRTRPARSTSSNSGGNA